MSVNIANPWKNCAQFKKQKQNPAKQFLAFSYSLLLLIQPFFSTHNINWQN